MHNLPLIRGMYELHFTREKKIWLSYRIDLLSLKMELSLNKKGVLG